MPSPKKVRRPATAQTLADKLNQGASGLIPEEEVEELAIVETPKEGPAGVADPVSEEFGSVVNPGDAVEAPETVVEPVEDKPWMANPQRPKDGVIVGPGEPIAANGTVNGSQVILQERVYRAHLLPKSVRWGYLLLYPKGTRIALAKLTTVNGAPVVDGKVTLAEKISSGETIKMPSNLAA